MASRQDWKDRKRDPNPRNEPPKAQVKAQKKPRTRAQDKPPAQKAAGAKAPNRPKAGVPNRKAGGGDTPAKKQTAINPLLRVTDTQSGTIHDEAARLKLRQTDATSPRELVEVEGNKIEVVARPEVLHPVALLPHQRDTVVKDGLRDSADPDLVAKADATVDTSPADWSEHVAEVEATAPSVESKQPVRKGK